MFWVGCLTDISFGILLGNMTEYYFLHHLNILFSFSSRVKIVIEEFCPTAHVPFSIFYLFYTEPNQNCNYYYYYFLMPIH